MFDWCNEMKFVPKIFVACVVAVFLFGSVTGVAAVGRKEVKLFQAIEDGDSGEVQKWIDRGADVNVKDDNGDTPLHLAAGTNFNLAVTLLISKGADVNAVGKDGSTPLDWAAVGNAISAANSLVSRGAQVNAKNDDGITPLHRAAEKNTTAFVTLLIDAGANVDAKDEFGKTPLHTAAIHNAVNAAELLIKSGADVDAKDKFGNTPLNLARENSSDQVTELIDAHIAQIANNAAAQAAAKAAAVAQAAAAAEAAAAKQAADAKAAADKIAVVKFIETGSTEAVQAANIAATIADDLESANIAYKVNNYKEAFLLYKSLAENGNGYALRKLAQMYEVGQGTAKDTAAAKELYQQIVKSDSANSVWAKERFYSLP